MSYIGSYKILEVIHKKYNTVLYRGQREESSSTVIIKFLRAKFPSSYEISRFKQEYEIIRNLEIEGVVKIYELISYDSGIALVLEDFDGFSLKELIKKDKIDMEMFFNLGVKISEIIGNLHKMNVVHRDIKPENILVGKDYEQIKVTDFGISQIVTHENEELYDPDVIEGTLKYISPEQTGRMNKAIDYRTDLYSLGITFYEMLTGITPFDLKDPLQIIHAHIAKDLDPPDEMVAGVPGIISDIVHKLLLKPAEERYQNAFGLMYDLRYAYKQWQEKGEIEEFELATHDFSLNFNIPQQIIGRENETSYLLECFESVAERGIPEILFVTGYPGVGKSFLVDELYKPIVARRGYFVSGKFEQFRKDVPYSAIILSFIKLIQQILVENNDQIEEWKQKIKNALGDNARVITDVIPQLKTIIGEPPEVPELGAEESENRFHYVFRNFLQVFATFEHPLVLVLDDLQWADMASLNLIQNVFISPENGHFFFIGTYRNNEVDDSHPLNRVMQAIRNSPLQMNSIHITPLDYDSVRRLLGKFLRLRSEDVSSLAEIVNSKTNGNPFFINQFMKRLYEKNMLEINSSGKWEWNEQKIQDMQITDNVVDLMVQKIKDISYEAREVLKVAGCIGNRFDLETMCIVRDRTPEQILVEMEDALNAGLVFFKQDMCYFLHDRIQEAAYSLISEEERSKLHYTIGTYTYRNTSEEDLRNKIFYIVNQLNAGLSEIGTREEGLYIARLNLMAGKKAKDSAAYHSARSYFCAGSSLLQDIDWDDNYDLIHELYVNTAEVFYLNGEFTEMENYLHQVLLESKSFLDKIKAYEIKIQAYMSQNRLKEAVDTTKAILSSLGVKFPNKLNRSQLAREFYKTKLFLRNKRTEDIKQYHYMKNPYSLAVIRIATSAAAAFYAGGFIKDITYIVCRMVRLSIKQGLTSQIPFWFSCYAMVLFPMNELEDAFKYSNLALELKKNLSVYEIRSSYVIYCYIFPWRKHIRHSLDPLLEIYHSGFEVGDVEYALLSIAYYYHYIFFCGNNLNNIEQEIESINDSTKQLNMTTANNYLAILQQVIHNLVENVQDPTSISGEKYDAAVMLEKYKQTNDTMSVFLVSLFSAQLAYLFGKIDKAKAEIDKAKKYLIAASGGMYHFAVYYFYRSLIILSKYPRSSSLPKNSLKKVEFYNSKLKYWSEYASMNFSHKHFLVSAEIARIKGDVVTAESMYEKAISVASENEFLQEEAIAYELSASFYYQRGFERFAALYLSRALACYSKWGSVTKVKQLKSENRNLIYGLGQDYIELDSMEDVTATSTSSGSTMLDLHTVLKASQAVSGEIVLERVLEELMKIGIENAGAQRGVLIFEREGKLCIEAESDIYGNTVVPDFVPIEECSNLPVSVINYVFKSNENLLLDNAVFDEHFGSDPYIEENRIKSILCSPIRQKSEVVAIVYLENNLTTNAFTPDRVELLRVISSQAAISIQNAKLFEVARRDGLTELINHRYFEYSLQSEIEEARRNNYKVFLLMLDIDNFKDVNDTHGHQAGDLVLKEIADRLRENSQDKDKVGRYGGEEFSVILSGLQEDEATSLAERIRREVERSFVSYNEEELNVTISIGMATYPFDAVNSEDLVNCADKALYRSKQAGRNRVSVF